jgi:hypothetical protein
MNKNLIYIGLGGLAIYYLFFKNKGTAAAAATAAQIPTGGSVVTATMPKTYTYPLGIGKDGSTFQLNEGDYVANGVETAILYQGQLRPFTAAWGDKYAAGTWARTKILDEIVYSSIPRGAVLDI